MCPSQEAVMRQSRPGLAFSVVAALAVLGAGVVLLAQSRADEEKQREAWQRVGDILRAMDARPGATVADIGAGDGFFTSRLAAAVGPSGRVYAVDISDSALERLRKRLDEQAIRNVTVINGTTADPRLPAGLLDAALIVNAYH